MKRNLTVAVLCVLLVIAGAVVIAQTIKEQAEFMLQTLAAEIVIAATLGWIALKLLREKYRRQKRPVSRWRFAIVQPLRRLFVSVWS